MKQRDILLVENDRNEAALTMRAFRKNNVPNRIITAVDGREALDYLRGNAGLMPGLILLDINLPGLDGLSILKSFRKHERTELTPVVMFTSSEDAKDVAGAYRLGANGFLRKPTQYADLIESVRVLSEYWLGLNMTGN